MSADSITPFSFESLPVRGALIHLSRAWRRMQRDHNYDRLLTETLGHAAAATGLIAQSLKFEGAITLQIQGGRALEMLVMQCSSELQLRGVAAKCPNTSPRDFRELTDEAHCAITVDTGDRPYQGIVAIKGESLSASLEHYFDHSVQVPSHVSLVANADVAGGLLLQQMPGQATDADDWNRLHFLAATLSGDDFVGAAGIHLLRKLFAEDDVRVHTPRSLQFKCRCSGAKVADVLRMLGEAETHKAVEEQGRIEIVCEYCGAKRHYDAVDVERIFSTNVIDGPASIQ